MSQPTLYLAENETTDGNKTAVLYNGETGKATLYFSGDFGGATVLIQAKPNDFNGQTPQIDFVTVVGGDAITIPQVCEFHLLKNTQIRAVIQNASGTTDITILCQYEL